MKRFNIVFDLDGTIATHQIPFWKIASEYLYRPSPPAPREWGFPEYDDKMRSECIRLFTMNWYMNDMLQPRVGAIKLINALKAEGHEVFIVTARHKGIREGTIGRVWKIFGENVRDIHFVDPNVPKMDVVRKLKADFYIDDKIQDCADMLNFGKIVFLSSQSWNMGSAHASSTKGMIRFGSIAILEKLIFELMRKTK